MDFGGYSKSFIGPPIDTHSLSTHFPILQHQFLSQPISPLLSTFLSPHQNRIPTTPAHSPWTPTAFLTQHTPQPEILPHVPQVPHDVSNVPAYFQQHVDHSSFSPVLGFKSLLLKPKSPVNLASGQESFYEKMDANHQQSICFPPFVAFPPPESAKLGPNNEVLSDNLSACPVVPVPRISKSSSFHIGYYVPPNVSPGDPYGGIDTVWRRHFDMLFGSFQPHRWSFAPTDTPLLDWNIFKDMAKVRFSCHTCQHGWTSMHGVVVFYYRFDPSYGKGEVRFALTGQKCIECQNQHFETPMWYPEEAQKVMTNLFYQIASNIYRLKTPPPIKDRRLGRPLKKHVASNCQGCDLGLCKPPSSLNSEQSKPSCQPNSSNSSPNNVANVSIDRS